MADSLNWHDTNMKREEIKKRPLSDATLSALEPTGKLYREKDSQGLYFVVNDKGGKSWQVRYKNADGKWTFTGIGSYPGLSGQSARKKAAELLDSISRGIYPTDSKDSRTAQQEASKSSLSALLEEYLDTKRPDWTEGTMTRSRGALQNHIIPAFGHRPYAQIKAVEWLELFKVLQRDKGIIDMANRVRALVHGAYDLAHVTGRIEYNPVAGVGKFMQAHQGDNMKHVSAAEFPDLLRAIRQAPSRPVAIGLELLAMLFCRPSELRQATWTEIDLQAALWSIPAQRMKKRRDHFIPLSRQAVSLLQELKQYSGASPYLFPGRGQQAKPASDTIFIMALRRLGYEDRHTPHGFRHVASTMLREQGYPRDHVEAALAHITPGVEGVYNKAGYLEQRRAMMQAWADHLDTIRDPQVIQFARPASA